MKMIVIISEEHKKQIINESLINKLSGVVKDNYNFVEKVISETKETYKLNLELLITWGASIGGFIRPINDFVNIEYPTITKTEKYLLITGIIATYFVDNKNMVLKVYNKIQEVGLEEEFKKIISKSDELYSVFIEFLTSLDLTANKLINIMSYTFIIPILPILHETSNHGNVNNEKITNKLLSSGLLIISRKSLEELIKKILLKFRK
jgi:hypothetical protein